MTPISLSVINGHTPNLFRYSVCQMPARGRKPRVSKPHRIALVGRLSPSSNKTRQDKTCHCLPSCFADRTFPYLHTQPFAIIRRARVAFAVDDPATPPAPTRAPARTAARPDSTHTNISRTYTTHPPHEPPQPAGTGGPRSVLAVRGVDAAEGW